MPNSRGIMQGRHNAAYYVSPSIPWKKYFIGCIMIKLINLTAYVNKTPSINRIAQKWQSILTSSTDGQFPIWPNAGTMVASGGVCSFVAMTAKPHNPDTSSMYRTPVKRNKNIICSPKNSPWTILWHHFQNAKNTIQYYILWLLKIINYMQQWLQIKTELYWLKQIVFSLNFLLHLYNIFSSICNFNLVSPSFWIRIVILAFLSSEKACAICPRGHGTNLSSSS